MFTRNTADFTFAVGERVATAYAANTALTVMPIMLANRSADVTFSVTPAMCTRSSADGT